MLCYLRGILYCKVCGRYTDGGRIGKLAGACEGHVVGFGKTVLSRLSKNQHPRGKDVPWLANPIRREDVIEYIDEMEKHPIGHQMYTITM